MQEKRFRYVSHTADVAFVAYGKTFKAALQNAALALLNVMLDVKKVEGVEMKAKVKLISEDAGSREDLVWFMLQDVLSIIDAEKLNAFGMEVESINETGSGVSAKARLLYKPVEADFAMLSVKAVTPHGLKVERTKTGYSISVVVDV